METSATKAAVHGCAETSNTEMGVYKDGDQGLARIGMGMKQIGMGVEWDR